MKPARSIFSCVLALSAGAACVDMDAEYRNALPKNQQVTIQLPGSASQGAAAGAGQASSALLGDTSEFYLATVGITGVVNGSAIILLGVLDGITEHPATSATSNSRTWGPYAPGGLDPLSYRLLVTKASADMFTFALDARPRTSASDADWLALLDGQIVPGKLDDTGKGTMTLHLDNLRALRPESCLQGDIVYAFDNTAEPIALDVMFDHVANNNPNVRSCNQDAPRDATYHYLRQADGAGDFVFDLPMNVDSGSALEDVSIRSRWQASGSGRSDVRVSGGDIPADLAAAGMSGQLVQISECWDPSFKETFEDSTPEQLGLRKTQGSPASCVYTSAMLP
jgi:hypothetical protein